MPITIELAPEIEAHLRTEAARQRKLLGEYLIDLAQQDSTPPCSINGDLRWLMALPREEQGLIMEASALLAAPMHEVDLALSPAERELTAFTALDGVDPILDYYEVEFEGDAEK